MHGDFSFPGEENFAITDADDNPIHHSLDELLSIWESVLPSFLDKQVQTFLCSLMIAFPGAAHVAGNVWLLDGKRHYHKGHYVTMLPESVAYLTENGFLPFSDLKPDEVHDWICSRNGIFDGYSDTPASRAVNYFTRLFVRDFRNDELSDLVWALAGIEALLVKGGRSSLGQLKEKLTALFADRSNMDWLTRMSEKMYNYRSRMVHGDRQIRSAFRSDEEIDHKRFDEEYDSVRFAVGLLLVLIQETIRRDVTAFEFKTICAN